MSLFKAVYCHSKILTSESSLLRLMTMQDETFLQVNTKIILSVNFVGMNVIYMVTIAGKELFSRSAYSFHPFLLQGVSVSLRRNVPPCRNLVCIFFISSEWRGIL